MKNLKKFENIFDRVPEPELYYDQKLQRSETNNPKRYDHYLQNREPWTDKEKSELSSIMDANESMIYEHGFTPVHQRPGQEIFYFMLNPLTNDSSALLVEIYSHKCEDEVYLVQIFQGDQGMDKRYFCDGFECLKKLISKYL
jgi:hypothetical protein